MALDASDLLVAVNTARAFLRTRYDTLRIDDSRRRLRILAQARSCGRGQQRGGIGPAHIPSRWKRSQLPRTVRQGPNSLGRARQRQPSAAR